MVMGRREEAGVMRNFSHLTDADLRDMLADLEQAYAAMDIFATPKLFALEAQMAEIDEELCLRELEAMEDA